MASRILVVLFILTGVGAAAFTAGARTQAADLAAARDSARIAREQAAVADAAAGRALESTLEARRVAELERSRRLAAERRAAAARAELESAIAVAPDTCDAVSAAALTALAAADSALTHEKERSAQLEVAVDTLTRALTDLRVATGTLSHATNQLEEASRPSLWSRIPLPRFSPVAITAGIDPISREARLVIGVSVSWPLHD